MNQTCQNCKKEFLIDADNQAFCDKMKVPYPTWCSLCRLTRRLAVQNAYNVFFRNCNKCDKQIMSIYRPDSPVIVYCQSCWWNVDEWDGTEYGMDYDSTRPFLEQWRELQLKTPQCALENEYLTLVNSEYTNAVAFMKNCYMCFWADYCESVYHSSILNTVIDSSDILRGYKSELCYGSVGIGNCSKTYFCDTCDDCVDVWFSRNCYGCMNCIGCVNLRGQSYMIFNQKYSREEYFEKIKEFKLDTRNGIKEIQQKSEAFIKQFPVREYGGNAQNFNVSGEYIFNSKNAKNCYMCIDVEDVSNTQFVTVPTAKDCYDYSGWGNGASQLYEVANCGNGVNNVKFSYYCFPDILNTEYSMWCIGAKNNFGCANLKRKQYAILNKVYDKETYEKLVAQIKIDMMENPYIDSKGRIYKYGEFFSPEFSLFPYNDSNAMKFLPNTKEEIINQGYAWKDKTENSYPATIQAKDLPQTINEVSENIIHEVISCHECTKSYKIANGEYTVLKKLNLPIPDICPKCREANRFSKINKPIFKNSTCAQCGTGIQTAHNEDKIIYCVKCYQQEIV